MQAWSPESAAQAVEILVRTGAVSAPEAWFNGRLLEGPVGYHNAQALLCAVGLPLAVWWRPLRGRFRLGPPEAPRAAPLLAVLFLTQSRAALAAAGIALAVQTALAREPGRRWLRPRSSVPAPCSRSSCGPSTGRC